MARVRLQGDPGGRATRRLLALAAMVALAVAPQALASDGAPPDFSLRSLAARPVLLRLESAPRFLERALPKVAAAFSPLDGGWRRFTAGAGESPLARRGAAAAAPAAITIDSGARVGCRIGDVVPYARLDVRSLSPRDPALGDGSGFLRALGVSLDLDARTTLQLEASLGAPDVGGPLGGDDDAVGLAIRLAVTF